MLNNKIDMMCHLKAIISCLQLSDLKSSGQVCVNLIISAVYTSRDYRRNVLLSSLLTMCIYLLMFIAFKFA